MEACSAPKPHSWVFCPDPDSVDRDDRRPGAARPAPKSEATFWVRCDGCGALVVTDHESFPGRCHDGWRMPADCEVAVVERIMEE